MSSQTASTKGFALIRSFEILLVIGMIFMAVGALGAVLDKPGLGIYGSIQPAVDAEIDAIRDLQNVFPTIQTDDGIVDAATGQAPVRLDEPVTAHLTFLDPTPSQRAVWVAWKTTEPLLALAVSWLVFAIVRAARNGDPFVEANERRLWTLALVIAVGGTSYSLLSGAAQTVLIQRSAAADQVDMSFTVSFLPIIIGVGVAALASVWHVGVGLRDDVEGMV